MPERRSHAALAKEMLQALRHLETQIFDPISEAGRAATGRTPILSRFMTDTRLTTIERAFQLAKAGTCRSVTDIRNQLSVEGYDGVHGHLDGMSIKRQLNAALAARGATPSLDDDDD